MLVFLGGLVLVLVVKLPLIYFAAVLVLALIGVAMSREVSRVTAPVAVFQ